MAKILTKTQVIQTIASEQSARLARKDVAGVLESLTSVGHRELKKKGIFVLPGLAPSSWSGSRPRRSARGSIRSRKSRSRSRPNPDERY